MCTQKYSHVVCKGGKKEWGGEGACYSQGSGDHFSEEKATVRGIGRGKKAAIFMAPTRSIQYIALDRFQGPAAQARK